MLIEQRVIGQRAMAGFTLVELLMVSSLAGILILSWSGFLSQNLVSLNQRNAELRQQQQLRAVGFWLSHELERARDNGEWDWVWDARRRCLLFSDEGGVRLLNNRLQWRGGVRDCTQGNWVGLNDVSNLKIHDFNVYSLGSEGAEDSRIQLSLQINGETVNWEYRFNGPIQLRQQG